MASDMSQAFSLKGKNVLITGGASGLGLAMAKCMASAGAKIIITGTRSDADLEVARKEINEEASCIRYDVTEFDKVDEFVCNLISRYQHIDVLVNNAGVHCKKPFEAMDISDLQRVLDVHLLGAFALTKALLPKMKEQKSGNVIFISSMSAFLGMTQVTAYASAKAAVLGLTRSLAGEYSGSGIRINAIVPGFIDTPMFHQATDSDPARQRKILDHTPMNSYGKPEDIGWAAVYLASPASSFVTGIALPVDGGCVFGF